MSKAFKFIIPTIAVATGIWYLNIPAPQPVFKGDGEWIDLKLTHVKPLSEDTSIYTFSFPESGAKSGLITASAILTKFVTPKGSNVIRPYTPINDTEEKGYLDLLVKTYNEGKMSKHIKQLNINDTLAFKGPILKWKYEANQFNEIGLIGGGTGITPLYQLVHQVLKNTDNDKTKITLLYGSKTTKDILLKPELDELAAKYPNQLTVKYFIDDNNDETTGDDKVTKGYITKEVIEQNMPKPSAESHIFICGPPPMYKAISGTKKSPTDQGEISGILKDLGYEKENVFKF